MNNKMLNHLCGVMQVDKWQPWWIYKGATGCNQWWVQAISLPYHIELCSCLPKGLEPWKADPTYQAAPASRNYCLSVWVYIGAFDQLLWEFFEKLSTLCFQLIICELIVFLIPFIKMGMKHVAFVYTLGPVFGFGCEPVIIFLFFCAELFISTKFWNKHALKLSESC